MQFSKKLWIRGQLIEDMLSSLSTSVQVSSHRYNELDRSYDLYTLKNSQTTRSMKGPLTYIISIKAWQKISYVSDIEHADKLQLAGQYKIALKVKQGAFGTVYLAKNKLGREFAIKVSKQKTSEELEIERDIYNALQAAGSPTGFVKVHQTVTKLFESGNDWVNPYLVMQLLGTDIQDIVDQTPARRLSLKSALMIGWQMIERLATLHALGYVHRDIKPDNMAVGVKEKADIIYLIDFGLAKRIDTSQHEAKFTGATVGTFRYMSVNSHKGLDLTKRDDIETLCYVLMFLIEGKLPWQGTPINTKQGNDQIKGLKETISKKSFTKQVPEEIFDMLKHARQLKYREDPDYRYLHDLLERAMKTASIKNDNRFEWINQEELKNAQKEHLKISPQKQQKPIKPKSPRRISPKSPRRQSPKKHNQLDREILAVFKFCNQNDKQSGVVVLQNTKQPSQTKLERPGTTEKPRNIRSPSAVKNLRPSTGRGAGISTAYRGPLIVVNAEAKFKI